MDFSPRSSSRVAIRWGRPSMIGCSPVRSPPSSRKTSANSSRGLALADDAAAADVPELLAPVPFGAQGLSSFALGVGHSQILTVLLFHEILFATLLRCASSVAICLWPCATVHLIPFWVCDPSCRVHVCFRFSLFRCWLAYLL